MDAATVALSGLKNQLPEWNSNWRQRCTDESQVPSAVMTANNKLDLCGSDWSVRRTGSGALCRFICGHLPRTRCHAMVKMKGKQEGVNKSAAIREILAKDLKTPTKEIIAILGQQGVKVKPHLVYLMKSQLKAKRRKQKREMALANGRQLGIANPVELIQEVRRLSERAGGIKHLKKLVDVLVG
jgi:hypothetical protein